MSETELTHAPDDRPTLARSFETVDIQTDGRNVEMLCVPYDIPATVVDPPPIGDGIPYKEEFARGAFAGAVKAPNRVFLEFEHWHPGLSGIIGHGAHLEERPDALYGRFRMTKHPDGDKALALIDDGVLTGTSVFFEPLRSARSAAGAMRRLKARLTRVALCPVGTWPQAKVLAVRSGLEIDDDEHGEPQEPRIVLPRLGFDAELAERLAAQGINVPERLRETST